MLHSALPSGSKACRPAVFEDFLAPNPCRRCCSVRAGALLRVCRLTAHNGTMQCLCCVCGCFRGRGCKEGAGGRDSPSCGTRSCVRFRSCRARVMRLWAGSHRCETLSLWFRTIWKFAFPWDEAVRSTKSPLKPLRTSYSVQPENNSRGGPDRSRPKRLIAPPLR